MTREDIILLNARISRYGVKMCTECEQVFPKIEAHFTFSDKTHRYFRPECKQCRADAKREIYQSDPAHYAWLMKCDRMQKVLEKGLHGVAFPSLASLTLSIPNDSQRIPIAAPVRERVGNGE